MAVRKLFWLLLIVSCPPFLSAQERQSQTGTALRPVIGISTNLPYDITYIPGYGLTSVPSLSLEYYPSKGKFRVTCKFPCLT